MTDPSTEPDRSRYVVGIDLGTTNSAVCFVDTSRDDWRIETFDVPQVVDVGQVDGRPTLPSFLYAPAEGELPEGAVGLPWSAGEPDFVVGTFAREHGRLVPGRLIDSAKSWLCHAGVDRTAPLLPWHGAAEVEKLSPVEVSERYLAHVRAAWDAGHPGEPLAEQDLVVTLPASFDEVARELTVEAAKRAGLPRVVLIEEPQAAFYSWIDVHTGDWESRVRPGQTILVCDIGGGTSDFTLIRARGREEKVEFHRVAVGEHLLLGGDNLDLALAHHVEPRLAGPGGKLGPREWSVLVRTCRHVKETLLAENAPESATITLPGTGSKLVGGGLSTTVTRDEVRELLVDGFLPDVDLESVPETGQSGFREFGLPFAADAAITRHLAAFLTSHRDVVAATWGTPPVCRNDDESGRGDENDPNTQHTGGVPHGHDPARPDVILFNGGFFGSPVLRARLLEVLESWFRTDDPDWRPEVLDNDALHLAVARGAAYFGMVRRDVGVRIAAGLPRTYYVGIEGTDGEPAAVCLLPAGLEPGEDVDLTEREFELSLLEPVEFPLFVSSTRLTDPAGTIVPFDRERMTPLPPIRTVLRTSQRESGRVRVRLHARLTEIGTLDVWAAEVDGRRSWSLRFDVRAATRTDAEAHTGDAERMGVIERESVETARSIVREVFGSKSKEKPGGLPKRIAREISLSRSEWPPSLLRDIWEELIEVESGRRRSADHESRWLNLCGFALRPGYGLAVDDWRVAETWRHLQGRLLHDTPQCRSEWWVLWRRIAGGLDAGQQGALVTPVLGLVRKRHKQLTTGRGKGADFAKGPQEKAEVWRVLGAFERLSVAAKIEVGEMILDLLPKRSTEPFRPAMTWALGRIGSRVPTHGPLNGVVPPETAAEWVDRLLAWDDGETSALVFVQLARRTHDRFLDLPGKTREKVAGRLERLDASDHYVELVTEGGELDVEDESLVFGEDLPKGLRLA